MERQDVMNKVKGIVLEHFDLPEEKITESLNLKDDLGADSITIMEVVLEIEEAFDIEVADEDMEKIQTIGDAVDYLSNK